MNWRPANMILLVNQIHSMIWMGFLNYARKSDFMFSYGRDHISIQNIPTVVWLSIQSNITGFIRSFWKSQNIT